MDGKPGFAFVSAPLAKPHGAAGFSSRPAPPPVLRFARGEERIPSRRRPAAGSAEGDDPTLWLWIQSSSAGTDPAGRLQRCCVELRAAVESRGTPHGGGWAKGGIRGGGGRTLSARPPVRGRADSSPQSVAAHHETAGGSALDGRTDENDRRANKPANKQTNGRTDPRAAGLAGRSRGQAGMPTGYLLTVLLCLLLRRRPGGCCAYGAAQPCLPRCMAASAALRHGSVRSSSLCGEEEALADAAAAAAGHARARTPARTARHGPARQGTAKRSAAFHLAAQSGEGADRMRRACACACG